MAGYFAIILVLLTLISGLIWLVDALFFAPKRQRKINAAVNAAGGDVSKLNVAEIAAEPAIVETARSIFPLIAIITFVRSFLYEPFQIPSGSMMPTLLVGDFILVEKFSYDVKDPIWRKPLITTGRPAHGDVAVFKYPEAPTIDYIKRIVGLPGDRIIYRNKQLFIQKACPQTDKSNCAPLTALDIQLKSDGEFFDGPFPLKRLAENNGNKVYSILNNPMAPENVHMYYRQNGTEVDEFIVPEGHYFAMGDNRDNSKDSRFFGFVPEANLVGKAVFIWMSFEFNQDPDSFLPRFIPVGVRLERLGPLE